MHLPPEVHKLVRDAASRNASATDAIYEAATSVRELPCYEALVESLVQEAIGSLVYAARATINREMRRKGGDLSGHSVPKVCISPDSTARVYDPIFCYRIGGVMLGLLAGKDLDRLIDSEKGSAHTKRRNAELLQWIKKQNVPADALVGDVICPNELRKEFGRLFPARDAA